MKLRKFSQKNFVVIYQDKLISYTCLKIRLEPSSLDVHIQNSTLKFCLSGNDESGNVQYNAPSNGRPIDLFTFSCNYHQFYEIGAILLE